MNVVLKIYLLRHIMYNLCTDNNVILSLILHDSHIAIKIKMVNIGCPIMICIFLNFSYRIY